MKKVITVFMIMFMTISMAACSSKKSEPASEAVDTETEVAKTEETTEEVVEEDTGTVVWVYEDRDALLEAFRSNGTDLDHSDEFFDYYVKTAYIGDGKESVVDRIFFCYGNTEEYAWTNMSQVQLELASLGDHGLYIDKKTVKGEETITISIRYSLERLPMNFELNSEGRIKKKTDDIQWLADEAEVNAFVNLADSYLAYTGLTLDDIIDFDAFIKAVKE